jgi:hypothetical protein
MNCLLAGLFVDFAVPADQRHRIVESAGPARRRAKRRRKMLGLIGNLNQVAGLRVTQDQRFGAFVGLDIVDYNPHFSQSLSGVYVNVVTGRPGSRPGAFDFVPAQQGANEDPPRLENMLRMPRPAVQLLVNGRAAQLAPAAVELIAMPDPCAPGVEGENKFDVFPGDR